jgi:hypothetical protein
MWLVVAREPKPDAPYWPGRRLLAAVDAAVWPLLWVLVFSHAPKPVGVVGPFIAAVALLCALGRLHRALRLNHRYWFTTWRWGRLAVALLLAGLVLNLAMPM